MKKKGKLTLLIFVIVLTVTITVLAINFTNDTQPPPLPEKENTTKAEPNVKPKNKLTLIFPSKENPNKLFSVVMVSPEFPPNIIHCISKNQPKKNQLFPHGNITCLLTGKIIIKNDKPVGYEMYFKKMKLKPKFTKHDAFIGISY